MNREIKILMVSIITQLIFSIPLLFAQSIPPYINYQGRLADQVTAAPINGLKSITFSLYDTPIEGTPIYSQTKEVNIINGGFSLYLGKGEGNYNGNKIIDGIPTEVFTEHSAQYLGIKIEDSQTEMNPRQLISSVAYAYRSEKATEAENIMGEVIVDSFSNNVGIGKTNPSEKLEVNGTVKANAFIGDGSSLTGLKQHSLDAADGEPTNALYVDGDGKVGIGTTEPQSKLSVMGKIESTSEGFKFPDGSIQTSASWANSYTRSHGTLAPGGTYHEELSNQFAGLLIISLRADPPPGEDGPRGVLAYLVAPSTSGGLHGTAVKLAETWSHYTTSWGVDVNFGHLYSSFRITNNNNDRGWTYRVYWLR